MRKVTIYLSNGKKQTNEVEATNTEIQNFYKLGTSVWSEQEPHPTIQALTIEN